MPQRPIILILGPTAGGKTRLAIELAKQIPDGGECVSADSMQVYRGMDIGTAKPTAEERAAVPHHLLDLIEPDNEGFSVDAWLEVAEQTIMEIRNRGRWPIVVGGTNLYIQALLHGLFEGPEPDDSLRQRLRSWTNEELRGQLERVDPAAADRIHPNDRKRTIRAIEVFEQTGRRISELQTQWQARPSRRDAIIVGLDYTADEINRRINARVKQMIERGLIEEVRGLYRSGRLGTQAREALGYKQILDALDDRCTMDEAIEQIKIQTRRYAKQQRTWLRRFRVHERSIWIEADELTSADISSRAEAFIERHADSKASGGDCTSGHPTPVDADQVDSRTRPG